MSKNTDFSEVEITRVGYYPAVQRWRYRHISFPTWRFYWNPGNGAVIHSGGQSVELTPDSVVLLPPMTPFSTSLTECFPHFFIHFTLQLLCLKEGRKIWQLPCDEVILPYFRRNIPLITGQRSLWMASSIIRAALVQLPEEIFSAKNTGENNIFNKAVRLIEEDPAFSLSDCELAERCGTSVNTLRKQFIQATGLSPCKWQMNSKMENAAQYLLHDGYKIKETAYMLGFSDRYHFSKVFKLYYGISPAKFVKSGGVIAP